ncbi:hypothetical protein CBR_g41619 [Chara braunii]|uniref:Reverse transcriptase RNase H-like domain-containing protein n=1 Tax=Chara braunii TaxID=69332 RepID=A0A388LW72_CHABU|nr:hypothetical protein CBR_g41619 [Chara braunii]|eukprot:GBG86556.1 hypothetical protein CBR_g41619 [Chara braunii]
MRSSVFQTQGRSHFGSGPCKTGSRKAFVLITDWQPEAISAILAQMGPSGLESVVEYASKSVPACKRNYAAPTGEFYAALWGISHFRAYLYGRKFTLVTDHEPLLALKKSTDYSGMIGRWAMVLQSMDFDIRHRKHERHGNADGLTRLHRPKKVSKGEEVIPWNEPEQEIGPRYGEVEILSKPTSYVTTVAAFSGDISSVNPQRHIAILTSLREWTEQVSNVWQHVLARPGHNLISIFAPDLGDIRRDVDADQRASCVDRKSGAADHPSLEAWRTNVEGDLLGFLFGSVWLGRRQWIAQELIAPIVQLADDLSPDIYSQSDDNPALHVIERSLDPYLQWTAFLEEPRDEDTLPSRQEYLKPYDIIPHAFYPRAKEVVIDDDDEEDEDEETSGEGSYSEYNEEELSEEEEEEEEIGSEWEALLEEATRTGTEVEDPEAARKREEIATGKRQLEFATEASLRIGNDPTRDPEPPKPEDGDPAAATTSTARRRWSRSPSSPSLTRPSVRPCTDAGDRPSSSDAIPPTP